MKWLLILVLIILLLMIPVLKKPKEAPKNESIPKAPYIDSKAKIPPIEYPVYTTDTTMPDDTQIIGIVTDKPRAYKKTALAWHMVVNEKDFSLTYCPLTDIAIGYKNMRLKASGKTQNGNTIFKSNDSLICQLTHTKDMIPAFKTTLKEWKEAYPDTLIMNDTGHIRDYNINPYPKDGHMLFQKYMKSQKLKPNTKVLGVPGKSKAVTLSSIPNETKEKIETSYDNNIFESGIYIEAPWSVWYAFYPETELIS